MLRNLTLLGTCHRQVRHLSNVGFEPVGSILYGQPRSNVTLDTRFGEGIAISNDGLRLAIGASGHDDPSGNGSGGNGGLFVYDFDAATSGWTQSAAYLGDVGEGLGWRFSMSADGSRLAIRRNPHTATSSVMVYNTVTKTQLGSTIPGCAFLADAVSLSPDGSRLAVSCEQFSAVSPTVSNAGKVDLYEWNASTSSWVSLGSIQGATSQSLFSTATAFDASGSRLAVSAVLYDGTSVRPGAVFVYQYSSSAGAWSQVGVRLNGGLHLDRFGSALALSADGTTLVVGAPTHKPATSSTFDGFVAIFTLVDTTWVAKGQVVFGIAGENLGRSVSVSSDGSRFAASAALAYNETGLVRLYEYQPSSTSWIQVNGDVESVGVGDSLGYGQRSIAMTGDGLRLAVGAVFGRIGSVKTGHARVFNAFLSPSVSPSASPSVSPTRSPTKTPTLPPTTTPIVTNPPSTGAPGSQPPTTNNLSPATVSVPPTIVPGKFDWDLDRVGPVVALFTDASSSEELMMTYTISHRTATVKIFDVTCRNLLSPQLVVATQTTRIISSTHSLLAVSLDIDQASVAASNIWKNGTTIDEGKIELCVRVDLVLDNAAQTSVNFHEQKLFLTIGLSQGFEVSQIDLDRDAADETDKQAQVDFGITSCQCNAARECFNSVLVQGDDVFICVIAPAGSDIEISAVEELNFTQGSFSIAAVRNSTSDALTTVFLFGKTAVIRSQLPSELFDDTNPANLTARGEVSVRFGSGARRNLRFGIGNSVPHIGHIGSRMMQVEPKQEQAAFSVSMALAPLESGEPPKAGGKTGAVIGGIIGGIAGVAIIVAVFLVARRNKEDDEEEEAEGGSITHA